MKYRAWMVLLVPMVMMVVGVAFNQIALWSNGGYMPVHAPEGCTLRIPDWNHGCMTTHTHFKWLGDWIIGNGGISSLGDFLQDASEQLKIPSILAWLGFTIHGLAKKLN